MSALTVMEEEILNPLCNKCVYTVVLGGVDSDTSGFARTMLAYELVNSILPPSTNVDPGALGYQILSHSGTDARRGTDDQDRLVWERHIVVMSICSSIDWIAY